MARKRKELPLIENFEISDVAAEGNAIGRHGDMVVFVPYGAPGDIVDIQIEKKKKSFMKGRIAAMKKPGDNRVEPRCEHFGVCGGCSWQHLPYSLQLECKRRQVKDAMERIAKIPVPEIPMPISSDNIWEYRNKMEYTFSNKLWLTREQLESGELFPDRDAAGFHIPGAFDKVLDIKCCYLQDDLGNRLRLFVKNFAKANGYEFYDIRGQHGFIRNVMMRIASTGQSMIVVQFGEDNKEQISRLLNALREEFPDLTSIMYVVNTKVNDTIADQDIILHSGEPFIEEEMEGLRFRIGPKSFYQTNSAQAYKLYSTVREMAALTGNELVYDLYTGTGTIANFVARKARKVIGVEYVEDAVADARINSQRNGIDNTEFFAGDMKDVLNDEFLAQHGRPDVMIVDPPRAGMHEDVVNTILRAQPPVIVYVSCNPATQARDLALLDTAYKVERIQPVDMFPHTAHIENVARLVLKEQD